MPSFQSKQQLSNAIIRHDQMTILRLLLPWSYLITVFFWFIWWIDALFCRATYIMNGVIRMGLCDQSDKSDQVLNFGSSMLSNDLHQWSRWSLTSSTQWVWFNRCLREQLFISSGIRSGRLSWQTFRIYTYHGLRCYNYVWESYASLALGALTLLTSEHTSEQRPFLYASNQDEFTLLTYSCYLPSTSVLHTFQQRSSSSITSRYVPCLTFPQLRPLGPTSNLTNNLFCKCLSNPLALLFLS